MQFTDNNVKAERPLHFEQDSYMWLLDTTPSESFATQDPLLIIEQLETSISEEEI